MSSIQDTSAAYSRPSSPSRGALAPIWRVGLPLVVIVAAGVFAWRGGWLPGLVSVGVPSGNTFVVRPMDLDITLIQSGEIKALQQIELKSEVEGQATIMELVPESTRVKAGDVLVVLASDGIVDRLEQEGIELSKIETDLQSARQDLSIQLNQNASDERRDELDRDLKKRELEKYVKGDSPKALQGVEIKIEENRLRLERKQDEVERSLKLLERGFVTQAKIDQLQLELSTLQMQASQNELEKQILETYEIPMQIQKLEEQYEQAKDALDRTKQRAASLELQATSRVSQFESLYEFRNRRIERLREQLAKCRIVAPTDGIVQYPTSGSWRWSDPLNVGSRVTEGQTICVIPDTSQMLVTTRIHEADRHRLSEGLACVVRVPAVPGKIFHGRLSKIARFADSANSWLNPDLKEHATEVVLDTVDAALSPGDSAEIEIIVDRRQNVLAVPVQSVHSRGSRHFLFVQRGMSAEPTEVTLGDSNVRFIEIRSGLSPEDRVLLSADAPLLAKLPRVEESPQEDVALENRPQPPAASSGASRRGGGGGGRRPG